MGFNSAFKGLNKYLELNWRFVFKKDGGVPNT